MCPRGRGQSWRTKSPSSPRPVSPRRISDPICQHSETAIVHADDDGASPCAGPSLSARVPPPRPIVTADTPPVAGFDSAPSSPLPCPADEPWSRADNGRGGVRHQSWRGPSRREHGVDLQQQQQRQQQQQQPSRPKLSLMSPGTTDAGTLARLPWHSTGTIGNVLLNETLPLQ